jgi:uncharacterized membrane protein YraQ (UPF0718 family)
MQKTLFLSIIILLILISIVFAGSEKINERLVYGLNNLCIMLKNLLPIVVIALFALAAIAYAIGQVFGAEMRSRATSWAMNMVVGGIVALIIWLLAKPIIQMLIGEEAFTAYGIENFCEGTS